MDKLKSSIEALKLLRDELHNTLECDDVEMLDAIIKKLEEIDKEKKRITSEKLLQIIANALDVLPTIIKILKHIN